MANYKTHRNIGIISSLIITSGLYYYEKIYNGENIDIFNLSIMIIIGIIGSLIPDIDLKTSTPSKIFKTFIYILSYFFSFGYMYSNKEYLIEQMNLDWIIINIIFILITLILATILVKFFQNQMRHRGIIHSIPFALFSSIILFEILHLFNLNINISNFKFNELLISILYLTGFMTHLILDEIYSVDFRGKKIKKSFGTALKLFDKKNYYGTLIYYILIILYFKDFIFEFSK